MRIALLTHNYPQNSKDRKDAGIFLYDFASELSKKAEVFIFCPNFEGEKEKYTKVPVTWFPWKGGKEKFGNWSPKNPKSILQFINLMSEGKKAGLEFAKKNKIDFCLAAWALPAGVFAQEVKKKLGIPYATWSLGSDINQYAKLPILGATIKNVLKDADLRFANSWLLCEKITKISGKYSKFMPAVTNLQTTKVKPEGLKGFNFLFVGRLEKVKGPDVLLEAINILAKKNLKFHMHILGDGSLLESLEDYKKQNKLEDFVTFHGRANEETVAKYMLGADRLVIPSRSESLPLVLLEAAKAGLPVIMTDVGDCKRMVQRYKVGFVANPEDAISLASAMELSYKQGKGMKRKLAKNLLSISNDFNQQVAIDILLKSVKEVKP